MTTANIYHGGRGPGSKGYTIFDRLYDQVGHLLLQGISMVLHLKPGATITADQDLEANVTRDLFAYVTRDIYASCNTIEIDAMGASSQVFMYGENEAVFSSDKKVEILCNMNGVGNRLFLHSNRDILGKSDFDTTFNSDGIILLDSVGQSKINAHDVDIEAKSGGTNVVITANDATNGNVYITGMKGFAVYAVTGDGTVNCMAGSLNLIADSNCVFIRGGSGAHKGIFFRQGTTPVSIKHGATQAAAGADKDELWFTVGHATLPNGTAQIGQ